MTWLAFLFALELGLVPSEVHAAYWPGGTEYSRSAAMYGLLETEIAAWETLFIRSAVTTYMCKSSGIYFRPSGIDFDFSAGIYLGPVTIAYAHRCRHPLMTVYPVPGSWGQAGVDRVYIRIEGEKR